MTKLPIKKGIRYKGYEDELQGAKIEAAFLLKEVNACGPKETMRLHQELLPKLFRKLGKNTWFEVPMNVDYGQATEIGDDCYFNHHLSIGDGALVKIGNGVIVGPYVGLYTATHPLNPKERAEGWQTAAPIEIGNNVWIGANVTILGGVKIGANSVIGAGSVVTRNIPANTLAYGVPAKPVRKLNK